MKSQQTKSQKNSQLAKRIPLDASTFDNETQNGQNQLGRRESRLITFWGVSINFTSYSSIHPVILISLKVLNILHSNISQNIYNKKKDYLFHSRVDRITNKTIFDRFQGMKRRRSELQTSPRITATQKLLAKSNVWSIDWNNINWYAKERHSQLKGGNPNFIQISWPHPKKSLVLEQLKILFEENIFHSTGIDVAEYNRSDK